MCSLDSKTYIEIIEVVVVSTRHAEPLSDSSWYMVTWQFHKSHKELPRGIAPLLLAIRSQRKEPEIRAEVFRFVFLRFW